MIMTVATTRKVWPRDGRMEKMRGPMCVVWEQGQGTPRRRTDRTEGMNGEHILRLHVGAGVLRGGYFRKDLVENRGIQDEVTRYQAPKTPPTQARKSS